MTAADISRHLVYLHWPVSLVIPNYTPHNWWECDVYELTKNGFMREYEIKLSRSDYQADCSKVREKWEIMEGCWQRKPTDTKHNLIARGCPAGPSRFHFVTPAGLLKLEEIPDWAGLIEVTSQSSDVTNPYLGNRIVKPAPQIHRCKVTKDAVAEAHRRCYNRYVQLYLRNGKDFKHTASSTPTVDAAW